VGDKVTVLRLRSSDNQTEMKVAVYEGDHKLCRQNHVIATFDIAGLQPLPRGQANVEVPYA
jgi:molecular chaperone DnaK (HSP70)